MQPFLLGMFARLTGLGTFRHAEMETQISLTTPEVQT